MLKLPLKAGASCRLPEKLPLSQKTIYTPYHTSAYKMSLNQEQELLK